MILLLILAVVALPFVIELLRRFPIDPLRPLPGHFAQLSQGKTFYRWDGPEDGPVAVCVHGLTTPSYAWHGIAKGLAAQGHRVLTYDLYGRGQSDRARGLQDRAFFLRQLDELLADQKIDGAFLLLGYSMGGAIVTTFAARSPERVQRLVLVASAGLGEGLTGMGRFIARTPVIGDWLMQAMYPRMHRQGTEAERSLTTALEGTIDLQQQELKKRGFIPAVLSSLRGLLSENLHADHETIHKAGVPVLAIWGGDDTLIGEDAWNRLTHLNPKAQQQVVDGAGHGLPYTHADDVLAALNAPKG